MTHVVLPVWQYNYVTQYLDSRPNGEVKNVLLAASGAEDLSTHLDPLRKQIADLTKERDSLKLEVERLSAERDGLLAERDELQAEIDGVVADKAAAAALAAE